MRRKQAPTYDLENVKQLASSGKAILTRRARSYLYNQGWIDIDEIVNGVFDAMSPDDFYKATRLENYPDMTADVYRGMLYDDEEWYVKFFIDDDENVVLHVWTLCVDGAMH